MNWSKRGAIEDIPSVWARFAVLRLVRFMLGERVVSVSRAVLVLLTGCSTEKGSVRKRNKLDLDQHFVFLIIFLIPEEIKFFPLTPSFSVQIL